MIVLLYFNCLFFSCENGGEGLLQCVYFLWHHFTFFHVGTLGEGSEVLVLLLLQAI